MISERTVALVMAAGYSRRFGQLDKRRACLPNGRTLLAETVIRARTEFPLLRVVLREEDDSTSLGLSGDISILRVCCANFGLGASLSEAITVLESDAAMKDIEAVAILLGDMPNIHTNTLNILRQRATPSFIIRPCHAGRAGHPVLFGRNFWAELTTLKDDVGGKPIIQKYQGKYQEVHVDDAGIHADINSPQDLRDITNPYTSETMQKQRNSK